MFRHLLLMLVLCAFSFPNLSAEYDASNESINDVIEEEDFKYLAVKRNSEPTSGVTYALDCGRFGDQLINYIKALWISHKFNLKFLYRPFSFSDKLQCSLAHASLSDCRSHYKSNVRANMVYEDTVKFIEQLEKRSQSKDKQRNLYIISFHTPIIDEWEDEGFRRMLSEFIRPREPIDPLPLPEDRITVALHVRTGIGFDTVEDMKKMPTKFPLDSFYIKALQHLSGLFEGQPLYIYIFTDHPQPTELRSNFEAELMRLGIGNDPIFDCRMSENRYDLNVLEDFFHMMQFDCVIRPDSSYSRGSAAVSWPIVEISPPRKHWTNLQGKLIYNDKNTVLTGLYVKIRAAKEKSLKASYLVP